MVRFVQDTIGEDALYIWGLKPFQLKHVPVLQMHFMPPVMTLHLFTEVKTPWEKECPY